MRCIVCTSNAMMNSPIQSPSWTTQPKINLPL
jgi:hypothetical protein